MSSFGRQLFLEGNMILGLAKDVFVPVDTGILRASGFVTRPVRAGNTVFVEIGFGGFAKDYALIQHRGIF